MMNRFYVSTGGCDSNSGTMEQPFKSIVRARNAIREAGPQQAPVTVYLREGTHFLDETLIFSAVDSGSPDAPITYSAYEGEEVVISGGSRLDLSWEPFRDGIMQAKTPAGMRIDQLFVNGVCRNMARYPNYDPDAMPYNGAAADAFSPERAARWADPTGGYIHAMHVHHWGGYHYRITGKTAENEVTYEGGWQNNRQMGMHREHRFVENIFEELDAPGEWYHNAATQTLYYYPSDDVDIATARVEISQLSHIVEFQGSQDAPVAHIALAGLIFRHAVRTFMQTCEPLLRSDWTIYRGGAVVLEGAEDCSIVNCEFDQVGGNAVFVNNYNRRIRVAGLHIHGAGASGVCFVGHADAVRNPLLGFKVRNNYADIDKTPGPKTDDYPADCTVEDCLIHSVGIVEKQATGVQVSMSKGITIRHCSIYDVGRAGINISEGTFGGHTIEFCDVFDTVRETGDHGSFNSWGRDRFWKLEGAPVEELPNLALLDTETSIIRNSRWRCDRGWDVDLDDGSSCYEIYNNLFLRGGLKLREGFHRRVWNNISVNNSLHPHVWYADSGDRVTGNIWMGAYRPAGGMPDGRWGEEVNRNMFTREADRTKFADHGCDADSVVGDPLFIDPANGDYRVKEDSPAFLIGFENFPMDKFGVQKPELKAIARVPVLPVPQFDVPDESVASPTEEWLGATVRALVGEEFSAFGVGKEDGGLQVLAVAGSSRAAKAGLKVGDVIQSVDGKAVKTVADLPATYDFSKVFNVGIAHAQHATSLRL